MYDFLDTSTPNSGLGTSLRSGGEIINANFRKLHMWMESRSNIATSTIPTLVAGGPAYLLAAEFVPGQPMPLALYERTSVAPTDVTHPAWAQSADGQWWKLRPQGGLLYIEQLGGRSNNSESVAGPDNLAAVTYAQALVASQWLGANRGYELRFGPGHWWFTGTIDLHVPMHIRGTGSGFENMGTSTVLHFPNTGSFIIIGGNGTLGETPSGSGHGDATGSIIENLTVYGHGSISTDPADHVHAGVLMLTMCHLRHVSAAGVQGDGIRNHGQAGFHLTDFSTIDSCSVANVTRNAYRCDGNDANVCHVTNFSSHGGIGGCGIHDSASYGNKYDNIHVAGYGNNGVFHLGKLYRLISYAAVFGGTPVVPGTNNEVWYYVASTGAATAQFPQWEASPAVPYFPTIPFLTNGASHVVDNLYVEGTGIPCPCHMPGATVSYAGTGGATRYSNWVASGSGTGLQCNTGVGGAQTFYPGETGYTHNGAVTSVVAGKYILSDDPDKGIGILSIFNEAVHGAASMDWRFFEKDIIFKGITKRFWEQSTFGTTKTFGRSTAQPDYMILHDVAFQNPGDAGQSRILGARGDPPSSGDHATGETFFMTNPAAYGFWAVTYSVAGNPGTSVTVPVFGLTSVTPQRNGDLVVQNTSNTQLTFKYKGSDGVIRTASLTLS